MRHVGDVNAHLVVSVFELLIRKGVIKILGISRVDGKGGEGSAIAAPADLLFRNFDFNLRGNLFHFFGEGKRKVVFYQDGLHLHLVVAGRSEHLFHSPERIVGVSRPVGKCHHHLLTIFGVFQIGEWYKNIYGHGAAVGDHKGKLLRALDGSHKTCFGAFYDLCYPAFELVSFALREEAHLHQIAMQCVTGVVTSDEDILVEGIGDNVGLAGLFHVDLAGNQRLRCNSFGQMLRIDFVLSAAV